MDTQKKFLHRIKRQAIFIVVFCLNNHIAAATSSSTSSLGVARAIDISKLPENVQQRINAVMPDLQLFNMVSKMHQLFTGYALYMGFVYWREKLSSDYRGRTELEPMPSAEILANCYECLTIADRQKLSESAELVLNLILDLGKLRIARESTRENRSLETLARVMKEIPRAPRQSMNERVLKMKENVDNLKTQLAKSSPKSTVIPSDITNVARFIDQMIKMHLKPQSIPWPEGERYHFDLDWLSTYTASIEQAFDRVLEIYKEIQGDQSMMKGVYKDASRMERGELNNPDREALRALKSQEADLRKRLAAAVLDRKTKQWTYDKNKMEHTTLLEDSGAARADDTWAVHMKKSTTLDETYTKQRDTRKTLLENARQRIDFNSDFETQIAKVTREIRSGPSSELEVQRILLIFCLKLHKLHINNESISDQCRLLINEYIQFIWGEHPSGIVEELVDAAPSTGLEEETPMRSGDRLEASERVDTPEGAVEMRLSTTDLKAAGQPELTNIIFGSVKALALVRVSDWNSIQKEALKIKREMQARKAYSEMTREVAVANISTKLTDKERTLAVATGELEAAQTAFETLKAALKLCLQQQSAFDKGSEEKQTQAENRKRERLELKVEQGRLSPREEENAQLQTLGELLDQLYNILIMCLRVQAQATYLGGAVSAEVINDAKEAWNAKVRYLREQNERERKLLKYDLSDVDNMDSLGSILRSIRSGERTLAHAALISNLVKRSFWPLLDVNELLDSLYSNIVYSTNPVFITEACDALYRALGLTMPEVSGEWGPSRRTPATPGTMSSVYNRGGQSSTPLQEMGTTPASDGMGGHPTQPTRPGVRVGNGSQITLPPQPWGVRMTADQSTLPQSARLRPVSTVLPDPQALVPLMTHTQ